MWGGGGGVLRFFHAYVGSGHFFWFSEKNKYFLGHENFVDIFLSHHKIGLYLGVISMHFRVFS